MKLLFSSVLLGLAWFAAINVVVSCAVWIVTRLIAATDRHVTAATLLGLRLAPAAVSGVFVAVIFLPAHWRLEPPDADESFGAAIFLLALLSTAVLGRVVVRGWIVTSVTWRLHRRLRGTTALAGGVFEVGGLAGVSLAGVFRPRILIGPGARAALTPAELDLAIAHERAHRRSWDNLKRCAMYCAPDVLGATSAAGRLEIRWRAEAECRADREAAAGDESRAVHLAAALIKVSRLAGSAQPCLRSPVWSSFHDAPLLERRVRSLLSDPSSRFAASGRGIQPWTAALLAATSAGWFLEVPARVHHVTEALVRLLP